MKLLAACVLALAALPEARARSFHHAVSAGRTKSHSDHHTIQHTDPPDDFEEDEDIKKKKRRRGPKGMIDGEIPLPWENIKIKKQPQPDDKLSAQAKVLLVIAPYSFLVSIGLVWLWMKFDHLHPVTDKEKVKREPEPLDEDVYGAGIACIVRDSRALAVEKGDAILRFCRFFSSVALIILNISLCIFLILQLQWLVADRAVTDMRKAYGKYEWFMYGGSVDNVYFTPNGFPRGIEKHFDPGAFDELEFELKEQVCAIPFSQPRLLISILFIWSLLVLNDLRRCGDLFVRLILVTPTTDSLAKMMEDADESDEDEVEGGSAKRHALKHSDTIHACDEKEQEIVALTWPVKLLLTITCLVPRWFIDVYVLWLGCRWLVASQSFEDLLLNAVGLEFILLLKDALYVCIQPDRNKRTTAGTLIQPWQREERANYRSFLSAFSFLFIALGWVMYYIYSLQQVLPDYKWDVARVCKDYITSMSSGKSPG